MYAGNLLTSRAGQCFIAPLSCMRLLGQPTPAAFAQHLAQASHTGAVIAEQPSIALPIVHHTAQNGPICPREFARSCSGGAPGPCC